MSCCVSVILPRLPEGVPIQRTLNSVRRQTVKDIELLSAVPIDADIAAEHDNLTICRGFDDAVARASGRYIYFVHPEGVLAFTALQRLIDTIGERLWSACGCAVRRGGKAFAPKSDALSLVHASLFDGAYVKNLILSGRISYTELDVLPTIMRNVDRTNYDGILVYIDEFDALDDATPPEMATLRVREYTEILRNNMRTGKSASNYALFINYVLKYYVYFDSIRRRDEPCSIMPLFEALSGFMKEASAQGDLLVFIRQLMDARHVELFLLPTEAFALLSPSRTHISVAPANDASAKETERLISFDIPSAYEKDVRIVKETVYDAVSIFAQGRAGLRTWVRCFFMWISFKLGGDKTNG